MVRNETARAADLLAVFLFAARGARIGEICLARVRFNDGWMRVAGCGVTGIPVSYRSLWKMLSLLR